MKLFQSYLQKGFVKKQKPGFRQVEKQITRARKDLNTFDLVEKGDPEWAATMAYQAMLRAGRALMFAYGFLPADGRQHKTVVELTGKLLDKNSKTMVEHFERLRRKRNTFFYDANGAFSQSETRKALTVARNLLKSVEKKIQENNPQIAFKL